MISKTHISAQKPRGRQLNAKVCGCKSAIFSGVAKLGHTGAKYLVTTVACMTIIHVLIQRI